MILVVTNRGDRTADFGILEMQRRGVAYVRLNTEDFPSATVSTARFPLLGIEGYFETRKHRVEFDEIDSVWFRRPAMPTLADDIQDPAAREFCVTESAAYLEGVWRALDCFWVSKPDRIRAGESKVLQLDLARDLGFSIPRTIVTCNPAEARDFFNTTQKIVYKPLRQGRVEYEGATMLIFTSVVDDADESQFEAVKYGPCLFQEYVPKRLEVRITVFGKDVFAAEIHSQSEEDSVDDWRRSAPLTVPIHAHVLAADVEAKCIQLVRTLDLAFGAIDMILTPEGEYVFLEINPNGQWAWIEQRTGQPMSQSLVDVLLGGGS